MKILVVSDSHGNSFSLKRIIDHNLDADIIVHCGDCHEELDSIRMKNPNKKYYTVRGNWRYPSVLKTELFFDELGFKFMVTHGHKYNVKDSVDELVEAAKDAGADIVLFGHTHIAYNKEIDGVMLLNPGATTDNSFGIVEINEGRISTRLECL